MEKGCLILTTSTLFNLTNEGTEMKWKELCLLLKCLIGIFSIGLKYCYECYVDLFS